MEKNLAWSVEWAMPIDNAQRFLPQKIFEVLGIANLMQEF